MRDDRHLPNLNAFPYSWISALRRLVNWLQIPIRELRDGIEDQMFPWGKCLATTFCFHLLWTYGPFRAAVAGSQGWLPSSGEPHLFFYLFLITSPPWMWAATQVLRKKWLHRQLDPIFRVAGLNYRGVLYPKVVSDFPFDRVSRRLQLTDGGVSERQYRKAKSLLEEALKAHIHSIRDNHKRGTTDIFYTRDSSILRLLRPNGGLANGEGGAR